MKLLYLLSWLFRRSIHLFLLGLSLLPARASLAEYDAIIRADTAAGIKPVATLTNAVSFFQTNKQAFAFGSATGDASLEFIVEGDPVQGGADGYLAVGVNSTSSLRFEQYNNTGQMGFTLGGVADYLFTPSVPSPNIPVHVTYVWTTNDHTMRLYLNGSVAGSQSSVSPTFQMPRGSGYLGNNSTGTEGMQGIIHRVTVYAKALPALTLRNHADAFNGVHRNPDIFSFTANPPAIFTPDPTTLTWSVSNATQLLLNGQDVTAFSGITLNPTATTDYQLIALNGDGSSTSRVSVLVNPAPAIGSFTATRSFVAPGGTSVIRWSTLYADRLLLSPSPGDVTGISPKGSGELEVHPTQTTDYQLTAQGRYGTNTTTLRVTVGHPSDGVVISEFLADNKDSLVDEDGNHSDWIELYNPTAASISLLGYALTDDPRDPSRWRLPAMVMGPGQYLVIFASGKNRVDPTKPLHTDFKLSKSGGFLGLSDPTGTLVHQFNPTYPPQWRDVSYGVLGGDPALVQFFGKPTPGTENKESTVPPRPVEFSRDSGTFTTPFTVALTSETTNAVIRYTLNGTVPSATNGTLYSGPITVDTTRRFRAIALASGLASELSAASYLRLGSDLVNYTSTLPILVIDNFGAGVIPQKGWSGDGSGIKQQPRQPAVWATFDRKNGVSALTNAPQMISRMGIRGRGAFSSTWRQKPFSVDTYDAGDGNRDVSPLGMPEHSEWILYFPDPDDNKDPAMIFNTFAYDLSRDMGDRYSVRFRWVEAFINEDGGDLRLSDRRGVYAIVEKVARGKNRLDFQPLSENGTNGGWILDLNRMDAEPETGWPAPNGARQPWFFHTAGPNRKLETPPNSQVVGDDIPQQSNGYLNFDTPNGYVINPQQRAAIEGWFKTFEDVFYNNAVWRDPTNGYRRYLDTRDFSDYFILNVLTHNGDGLLISMYPWKGDDGKLRMGPAWDYNWSAYYISGAAIGDLNYRSEQLWYPRLFADPDFSQGYIDRWWQMRAGPISDTNIDAIIDRQMADIGPAKSVLNGMPSAQEWINRLTTFRTWVKTRAAWMDSNYLRPPIFSRDGGLVANGFQLAIGTTNGVIYYTTDGSDPRAPGGAVSSNAVAYAVPVVINAPTTVQARSRKGTAWSGLTTALFQTPQDLSTLAVTEIHYNPAVFGKYPGDDLEFLELKNVGGTTLDLGGLSFTSGITFTFPAPTQLAPGAFYLLGRNATALQARYPGVKVAGLYTDKLSNSGETIALGTPQGGLVFSIDFNDRAPWPLAADGYGYSLVPRTGAPRNSANGLDWRSSSAVGGSPGADDPETTLPRVYVNEVITHSVAPAVDQIELFNPGPQAVDLGGWFLSDDATVPRKFRIPAGTTIAAGGYRVFDESDFNAVPAAATSFSLSSSGDSLYLSSGDGSGNLTGYSHGFAFGASDIATSFGRYLNSIGREQFPLQRSSTIGSVNSGPQVGPVVISEISYHPDLAGDEFLEIRNISNSEVALYDSNDPTLPWRLNGVGYLFPSGASLPAQGVALLTAGDPEVFRAKYGLDSTLRIWGPYPGVLQGRGETLQLQRPGIPDTNGVPYITVDEVTYDDHAPWPSAADGSGASLQRIHAEEYGDDPGNWQAAVPTPGAPLVVSDAPVQLSGPPIVRYPVPQTAELSIAAQGTPPLRYQWLRNGDPLSGETNAILRLTPLLPALAGDYSVVVYNTASSATSPSVLVVAPELPNIYLQPVSRSANLGTNTSFTVAALSASPLTYQWFKGDIAIPKATNATLILTNLQSTDAAVYQVFVAGTSGGVYSLPASLTVITKPSIRSILPDQTVVAGDNVRFDLEVGGTPPFTVKWRRGTVVLSTVVVSSNQLSYTVTNILVTQGAKYNALVSNPAGANVPSNDALITVLADTDRDHIPDVYENTTPGLSATNASDAAQDFDRDGFTNLQEYQAGTDPNDPKSYLRWEEIVGSDNGVMLRFQSVSNRTYSIQFKTDLLSPTWTVLTSVPQAPTNALTEVLDSSSGANERFYRLVTPR